MKIGRIITIILVVAAIVAGAYAINTRLAENKTVMAEKAQITQVRNNNVAVTIESAQKQSFSGDFTVNGTFRPSKELKIISDVNGRITSLSIDEGVYVKQGQVVLSVDNELMINQLKSLQLNLDKAKKDLIRMQNLLKEGGVTETQYEEVKLGVESLEIQIASVQKQIKDTSVKSPIAGVVNQMMVENGSYLAPGSPIANVVNTNPIELETYLTEEQVITVKNGQKVNLSVDVLGNKTMTGTVNFIDVVADNAKRFPVRISVANNNNIKAGMNGKATFSAGQPVAALVVSREAFVGSIQDGKVFVLDGTKAVLRKVTAGNVYADKVEIVGGINEGDKVITSGQINLQDNAEVVVIQ